MTKSLSLDPWVKTIGSASRVPFEVVTPSGTHYRSGQGRPAFTLLLRTEAAVIDTLVRGHMGLLERYFEGEVDLDGSLGGAIAVGIEACSDTRAPDVNMGETDWQEWRLGNADRERAKANARAHFGLGEPFYRLWLDQPLKMHTCAYWADGARTLEVAQCAKVDHVCRKLMLQPGERFLDIGCGFGGFMLRAWDRCRAIGTGIDTTTEQVEWLGGELRRRGLDGTLHVREADFRERVDGVYDKVVSIGVLEHAGRDQLAEAIKAHAMTLKPGGLGLLHFIGHVGRRETELFIRKHVFQGGWIPSLADVLVEMERCGLEVLDIENLRRHYALTLDAWAARFDLNWPAIRALDPQRFDERFRRIWRVYLVGGAELFRSPAGRTHLFQVLFSRGNVPMRKHPMTRDYMSGAPLPLHDETSGADSASA